MKPDAWPFVPPVHRKKLGEGPFCARGTVFSGNVEYAQRRVPGGMPAVYAEIGIPAVEAYFRDTIFLATSFYDIEPLMHLLRAMARIEGLPLDKRIRENSHVAGGHAVSGMYRAQLRSTSTEEMAERLPRIFGRYFDRCQAETQSVTKGATEMRFRGLPASALGFYVWSSEGFVAGALESAGARDVRFTWTTASPGGEFESIPLQAITAQITWSGDQAAH
jgi:hypothetical protein